MPQCPECGDKLKRIHRKFGDRVKSAFTPVNRFRCVSHDCDWEGTFRSSSRAQKTAKLFKSLIFWAFLIIVAIVIGMRLVR